MLFWLVRLVGLLFKVAELNAQNRNQSIERAQLGSAGIKRPWWLSPEELSSWIRMEEQEQQYSHQEMTSWETYWNHSLEPHEECFVSALYWWRAYLKDHPNRVGLTFAITRWVFSMIVAEQDLSIRIFVENVALCPGCLSRVRSFAPYSPLIFFALDHCSDAFLLELRINLCVETVGHWRIHCFRMCSTCCRMWLLIKP